MSDVPLFGTFTMTTQIDGNIQYTPKILFNDEEYIETVGDVKYKYTKNESGKWSKEIDNEADNDSMGVSDDSMEDFFNPDNFEKVKDAENTYKQKEGVNFDEYNDVKIIINDDSCTIEMSATSEGMVFGVKIVISKINEIELTLPTVD